MAVGQGALVGGLSYLSVGRETTTATYNTCTAGLDFLSSTLKTVKENKILEQIQRGRVYACQMSLGKVVEGEVEYYYQPENDACNFILQNALGGTVTSATATGETAGAGANSAMTHTFLIGNMDQSAPALCLNHRKGPVTSGRIWQYTGAKVDELMFTAEINEPLIAKASLVCVDSTQTTNDVEAGTTFPTCGVLSFVGGRFSAEGTFASLTSTSFWHIISAEFGWANSMKKDDDSRRIGSDILVPTALVPGIASLSLNLKIRFDTTTAYDAMMNATQFSTELEFLGPTLSGSVIRKGIKVQFPKCYIKDAGDPEVGGPDDVLTSDVVFNVLRDESSSTGYAIRALVTNQRANYSL